jgi:hypothetical protein
VAEGGDGAGLTGPLAAPVTAMLDAAAGGDTTADQVRVEAAVVASWLLSASGAVSPEGVDALRSVVGPVAPADVARPDLALIAPDAVLGRLLAARTHLDAWRYYLAVMELAHGVVALDLYPTAGALALLDVLRTSLLGAIDAAGARPGRPPGGGADASDSGRGRATDADAEVVTPAGEDVEELLAELDDLIGLEPIKAEVRRVADRLLVDRLRGDAGLKVPDVSRHLVFTGNPGTGKTTVARLLGRCTRDGRGRARPPGRDRPRGLVAGYVGQTATRVKERFDEADGGVLLIDEAYALARGGERDFGREAIDAVVKLAEDRRDRVVVILTGYPARWPTSWPPTRAWRRASRGRCTSPTTPPPSCWTSPTPSWTAAPTA